MRLRTYKEIFETINHPCDCMSFNSLVGEKQYDEEGNPYYVLRYSIMFNDSEIIESGYLKTTNADHIRKFKTLGALYDTVNTWLDWDTTSEIWFVNPEIPENSKDARQMGLI